MWEQVIPYIVMAGFAVLSALLGKKLQEAKGVMKELVEAMKTTIEAMEDGKITYEEAKKIVKEWKDVLEAFIKKKSPQQ